MSHFTTVKTVVRDKETLCETLRNLHYNFQEGTHIPIHGYQGNNAYGEVVINTGSAYDIGFQQQGEEYAVCADWWGVQKDTSIKQESFLQQLNQSYSHCAIKKQVLIQGYIIEEETINAKGEIELVICAPM